MADRVACTLTFASAFGSRATAQTAETAWTFKRTGFFTPKVTARVDGTEPDVAVYEPNWTHSRGVIRLQGGEQLQLAHANFWDTEWALSDAAEQTLLRFHNRGIVHHGAGVEVMHVAQHRGDLPLLVALTWYVLVPHMEDSAAAAG